jgi:DNA polymerase II large subunit
MMDYTKLLDKEILKNLPSNIIKILKNPLYEKPSLEEAVFISKNFGIPLHPKYLLYWKELSVVDFDFFLKNIKNLKIVLDENDKIVFSEIENNENKVYFENLGLEHEIIKKDISKIKEGESGELLKFDKLSTEILLVNLGLDIFESNNINLDFLKRIDFLLNNIKDYFDKEVLDLINLNHFLEIRDKAGTYIGARMGRPEKAKMRKQFNKETKSHSLFPVGEGLITKTKELKTGEEKLSLVTNRNKNILDSFETGFIEENFRIYYCENCKKEVIYPKCPICGSKTKQQYFEKYSGNKQQEENEKTVYYKKVKLNLNDYETELRKILGNKFSDVKLVKGIKETINKHHTVEHLAKGFFRALNDVYVNKDGTVRYDMIEMGITHFKPKEIGTSIQKLRELGYETDIYGNPLENEEQILEMFPQDVILPDCPVSGEEKASDFIINTGNFVDDLLENLYGLNRFYNFKSKEDTIGHLIIGLAPHTSAGIIGRIIGYSQTQGCFSHPVWHAAQRRNLDGDENGIMLLLDGLINFSRDYLPDRRGSRTMDVSLVLTSHLYLDQIDDEVHGMDIVPYYPLEFYQAAKEYKSPKEVKIEKVGNRVYVDDWDAKYRGYMCTHTTNNMNNTILCSSYKYLPSMKEKLDAQLDLAKKIRAVDEDVVGTLIIDKHFMKDIKGNLRKFGMQSFRCAKCNTIYRRPPLSGKCEHCGNPGLIFTISEGSVKKYIEPSFSIINKFKVDPYVKECIELVDFRIKGVFGEEKEKQKSLTDFFGNKKK